MGDETVDVIEAKYISGLSTVMVATIQEAKDRISQIEYIFCSQLFPNFQSKSKAFEKVYSEARLAACDAWKEKEKELLSQIEELKSENLGLVKGKEKLSEELVSMPLRLKNLEDYIAHLKRKLKSRSEEVENSVELHTGLVQVLQVKGSDVLGKDEVKMLLLEVKSLKEELSKKTLVTENLLKKMEHLSTEAADSEEQKQRLTNRLQVFEENVGRLEEMLRQKTDKIEALQGKLNLIEKENTVAMGKAKALGEELSGMNVQVKHGSYLAEEKSVELAMEIKKRNEVVSAFKKLKSQYNYLRKRFGLTTDSDLQQSQLEDESNQCERPAISKSPERKQTEADKVRIGTGSRNNHENESITNTLRTPTTSITRSPGVRSDPSGGKALQLSGSKRPASIWRDTRSRQSPGGNNNDPHDDFLDTPIENIKRVAVEEKHVPADSDDETQDMNPKPRQRIQVAETSKKGFKHVESVRKKAERENLKGVECKQCKKFYDAVHPENEGSGKSLRCEHHEGVSRHRYKYAPPMTPEGFWNIGFESEMP